jgi:hypothetical protein
MLYDSTMEASTAKADSGSRKSIEKLWLLAQASFPHHTESQKVGYGATIPMGHCIKWKRA